VGIVDQEVKQVKAGNFTTEGAEGTEKENVCQSGDWRSSVGVAKSFERFGGFDIPGFGRFQLE
jgi:hypothetical protein